jgi:hypothetical protein
MASGQTKQKALLPAVLLLLRDETVAVEMCILRHQLATCDVFGNQEWLGVFHFHVFKCGRGHMTSTEALPSNGCVYRGVSTQRLSLLASQFRHLDDM